MTNPPAEDRSAAPWRLAIVDDSPDDRREARRLLLQGSPGRRRYQFLEAETGEQALRTIFAAGQPVPDCAILDFHLPDMAAPDLLRAVTGPEGLTVCPFVVLTGSTGHVASREILRAGAQDYVGKSWTTSGSLTRAVENAVERHALAREVQAGRAALTRSEAFARSVVEASADCVKGLSLDGRILWMNENGRRLMEVGDLEAVRGKPWTDFWDDPGHRAAAVAALEAARSGRVGRFRGRCATCGGAMRWWDVAVTPIHGPRGAVDQLLTVSRDVTEQRAAEQALRETDRRKDEFLATLAHELRNPLAPIRTGLEVLQRCGDRADLARSTRELMQRQLTHMVHLIDDLLDISRINSGKVALRPERCDLRTVVQTALEAGRPAVEAARHTLAVDLPTEAVWIDGDATRLAQVVSNLLNNSAKYTPPGGHIDLAVRAEADAAVVTVSDDGLGIPRDMLGRIFEMFTQVDRADRPEGLGIGLALVWGLVELHGGSVTAASDGPGRGSRFTVQLPLASAPAAPAAAAPSGTDRADPSARRRVLVVDDNEAGATLLTVMLGLGGHEVRAAHDGVAALEVVREFRPDVVFCDIGLPGLDGYEVARRVRQDRSLPPSYMVALTGWGSEDDRRKARDAGFDRHLTKPVAASVIHDVLVAAETTRPAPEGERSERG